MESQRTISDELLGVVVVVVCGVVLKLASEWADKNLCRRNRRSEKLVIERVAKEEEIVRSTWHSYPNGNTHPIVLPEEVYHRENWIICKDKQVFFVPNDVRHFLLTLKEGDEVLITSSQPVGKKYRIVEDIRSA
ncbi:MAG: hypothetical protein UT24_C0022G0001 [Candidatus Woesebacteria bacterium GW2011_GWB1_39_12]|uniref:Uncharacterized protein n=1 Tax=Candidatus Woesebacteria bacterium GW2011_GWB1_39_12 TaxID=1618574 RepID=A0A0G0MHN3_9BACT|nr:MAG: hypothetical protein UT24_C0022G0001 [Candidatus Woesebacteria bacterium GW2011_GWB1_39_12]